ncbi:MAG TPA: hypothetical protein VIM58_03755 [Candidatus Methylacidiphilales bacterium]
MTASPSSFPSLQGTVFAYGSPCDSLYGHLVLRRDGTILGTVDDDLHPAPLAWAMEGEELVLRARGVASRYRREGRFWSGRIEGHLWPLVLLPVLENDLPDGKAGLPPLFVQSIPKSGTYFLEKALAAVGWRPTRLHLCTGMVDDYRGLPDEQVHVNPLAVRYGCPEHLVAATLRNGQMAVGHLARSEGVEAIEALGVVVVRCVRDLRDVLASLYRFKLGKVHPVGPHDLAWRRAAEAERFDRFLHAYLEDDVRFVGGMAESLLRAAPESLVRYEELETGKLPVPWREKFEGIAPGLSGLVEAALAASRDSRTPTYSGKRSQWRDHWTPQTEAFFEKTGLRELNRRLGYES